MEEDGIVSEANNAGKRQVLNNFLLLFFFSKNLVGEDIIKLLLRGLNSFSSKLCIGIYIYGMIRLDYFCPDRTLKIKKDKGVFHELKEEEFFQPKIILKFFKFLTY